MAPKFTIHLNIFSFTVYNCKLKKLTNSKNTSTHILNPKTQRLIKVGGKVWRQLVNEGILEKQALEHELYKADSKEEAVIAKKMLLIVFYFVLVCKIHSHFLC